MFFQRAARGLIRDEAIGIFQVGEDFEDFGLLFNAHTFKDLIARLETFAP